MIILLMVYTKHVLKKGCYPSILIYIYILVNLGIMFSFKQVLLNKS